ncbi:MAG: hypothetical protein AB8B63_24390 [Granulosicoccus sp.]
MNPFTLASTALILALLTTSLFLSSCSDSSQVSEHDRIAEETIGNPSVPLPLNGTLTIAERSGKTILDASFSRAVPEEAPRNTLWSEATDICFEPVLIEGSDLIVTESDRRFERAAETIAISSRIGNYVTLFPQKLGKTVVYAADALWQDEGLPDDAVLSLTPGERYESVSGIGLTPLTPLVRLAPENGQLLQADNTVRWENAPDSDARIRLTTAGVDSDSDTVDTAILARVHCDLIDDGFFDIPASVREALGNPLYVSISITRFREMLMDTVNGDLLIVQTSQN